MATNAKDRRLPAGLIGLLTYQWLTVVSAVGMGCLVADALAGTNGMAGLAFRLGDRRGALRLGSHHGRRIGRNDQAKFGAFLVGIVCHVLLEICALIFMFMFLVLWFETCWNEHGTWVWDPFFLIFAGMWSPFVLISAWAIFYLRKLRRSLLPVPSDMRAVD